MSARTKVGGNPAIRCDEEGCTKQWITQGWWVNAAGGRRQALVMGWTRRLREHSWVDLCPNHSSEGGNADG